MPMLGRCMIFNKFQVWRNARTCIKCSSWIVKEDSQEQHLTCKKTKFMLLFFGHKCLPFSLTWQVSLTCKSEFLQEREKKKCLYVRQRDRKEFDCMKSRKKKKKKKKTRYSIVWSLGTIKKYSISVISSTTLFF